MTTELARTNGRNVGTYGLIANDTNDLRLVDMWLATGRRESEHTQSLYLSVYLAFSASVGVPLQHVTVDTLLTWQRSLKGEPATQRLKIAAVKSLFSFGVKTGYLALNPSALLKSPHVTQRATQHVMSTEDVQKLVNACQTATETALVRCLYSSGARISEVLALKWLDLTPRDNDAGAHLFIASGKGGKERTVGVNAAAYTALLALREGAPDSAFCFATRSGKALDRTAAHRTMKRLLRRAGLPENASCHWLRHSHATHSLEGGAGLANVMSQLGHASVATTSIYLHASAYSSDVLAI